MLVSVSQVNTCEDMASGKAPRELETTSEETRRLIDDTPNTETTQTHDHGDDREDSGIESSSCSNKSSNTELEKVELGAPSMNNSDVGVDGGNNNYNNCTFIIHQQQNNNVNFHSEQAIENPPPPATSNIRDLHPDLDPESKKRKLEAEVRASNRMCPVDGYRGKRIFEDGRAKTEFEKEIIEESFRGIERAEKMVCLCQGFAKVFLSKEIHLKVEEYKEYLPKYLNVVFPGDCTFPVFLYVLQVEDMKELRHWVIKKSEQEFNIDLSALYDYVTIEVTPDDFSDSDSDDNNDNEGSVSVAGEHSQNDNSETEETDSDFQSFDEDVNQTDDDNDTDNAGDDEFDNTDDTDNAGYELNNNPNEIDNAGETENDDDKHPVTTIPVQDVIVPEELLEAEDTAMVV